MAFYLKYRPQRLADLDLKEVKEGLAKALFSKEVPHAFLFAGPRGTGKTSAARIVAKAINCVKKLKEPACRQARLAIEPCNKCDPCLSITAGTNLDVLEIDAASNRGIDDIRNLREKIKLAPVRARYKVYIIDESHMLTTEAFNALLKTLEEPPKHAIFVLCTTAPEKLPQTIISRCLRFNFRKAKVEELITGLEKIVKAEKLKIEKGVLEKIARAADGSFRDSQKILEQLSFEKGKITAEKVDEILGQVGGASPEKLLRYLVDKDARRAVLEIERAVESGANLRWYSEQLLELLRQGLLNKLGIETDADRGSIKAPVSAEASAGRLKFAEVLKIEETKNLIEIFSKAAVELKTAIIPQLPLEMGVVEWCEATKDFPSQPPLTKWSPAPRDNFPSPSVPSSTSLSSNLEPLPCRQAGRTSNNSLSFDSLCQKWPQVLEAVGPKNHSVKAFLRATRPKEFDGESLILEVFYQFHKTQLETDKCRNLVEETAAAIFKIPVKIKCVLGEKPPPKPVEKSDLSSGPSLPPSFSGLSSPFPAKDQEEKYRMPPPSQLETDSDIMKVAEEIFGKTAD